MSKNKNYSADQEQVYKDRIKYYEDEAKNAGEGAKAKYFEDRVEYYKALYFGSDVTPYHGTVVSPKTMAIVCEELGLIQRWQNNEFEGGKSFPATTGGQQFPNFPDDAVSGTPPADEHILSGGKTDARDCVNFTNEEMRAKIGSTNFDWRTTDAVHKVKAGDQFNITWEYAEAHKTRGYDYWITKQSVDFTHRLTREDFDDKPFQAHYNQEQPYWNHPLTPSTSTSVTLPDKDPGHHVLLLRWVVADTGIVKVK